MYQVSIIIPIYKVEKYIERCARSLFEQTLSSIEFIFVNDCSPDNSINILQSVLNQYPNRIPHTKIIHHEYNRGSAAARNTGRRIAQGEYIIECDSDDWVEFNMYELMYQTALKNNADIVICDWNEVYNPNIIHIHVNPPSNNLDCVAAILSRKMHGSTCNKLIKKELYTKHSIMCTEGINLLEDLNVTYRLFYYAKTISYINKPLYYYFKGNENSYTSSAISEQSQKGFIQLIEQIQKFIQKENISNTNILQAFTTFKLAIRATILLGSIKFGKKAEEYKGITIKEIISNKNLTISFKTVLILDYIHCYQGIRILRFIRRKFK